MRRVRVRQKVALLVLAPACLLVARAMLAEGCPPCYYNYPVMQPNAGNGWTQNGQRKIRVGIDSSWDSTPGQTDDKVWDAVNQAASNWNDARGAGNLTGPYHFQVDQTCLPDNCDIKIVKESPRRAENCLETEGTWSPDGSNARFRVRLPQGTANSAPQAELDGMIAHELGHPQGVVDVEVGALYCGGTQQATENGFSIMGNALPGCAGAYTDEVQPKDIDAANHKIGNGQGFGSSDCHFFGRSDGLTVDCTDPCADSACPGFDLQACANYNEQSTEYVEYQIPEQVCVDTYTVTSYYWCIGGSCTYAGSFWEYQGTECMLIMY